MAPSLVDPGIRTLNDLKIGTCRLLARLSVILGWGNDWLAKCHDNVSEWDIRSWS